MIFLFFTFCCILENFDTENHNHPPPPNARNVILQTIKSLEILHVVTTYSASKQLVINRYTVAATFCYHHYVRAELISQNI